MSRCGHCGYYWKDDEDRFATCHFEKTADWDLAPCEYDDEFAALHEEELFNDDHGEI